MTTAAPGAARSRPPRWAATATVRVTPPRPAAGCWPGASTWRSFAPCWRWSRSQGRPPGPPATASASCWARAAWGACSPPRICTCSARWPPSSSRSAAPPERFLEEARLTARLDHPNIVPVHDAGVDGQGRPFYVMRRVQGGTLADALARGEMPALTDRLEVFLKVCDALAFAHERGVLHCDLKPANVMVERHGEVRVMDWGLARELVQSGGVGGTPRYAAPEQLLGEPLDVRTDVYALGELLYELLTGTPPFEGEAEDVRARKLRGEVTPPARRAAVPRELGVIALKAMERHPARRYPAVASLRAALGAFQEGRLVPDVRYAFWERAGKWVGRHRHLVGTALFFVLAALAGGVKYLVDIRARNAEIAWQQRQTELRMARALASEQRLQEAWETLQQGAGGGEDDALTAAARVGLAALAWEYGVPLRAWQEDVQVARDPRVAVSEDGQRALVGWFLERDRAARATLWSLPDLHPVATWEAEASALDVRFVDGEPRIFQALPDGGGLQVLDPRDRRVVWALQTPVTPGLRDFLALSPSGRSMALTSWNAQAGSESQILRLGSPSALASLPSHVHAMDDAAAWAVLPDPTAAASLLVHLSDGVSATLPAQGCTLFSPQADRIACGKDARLAVFEVGSGALCWRREDRNPTVRAFQPDGAALLVNAPHHALALYTAAEGSPLRSLRTQAESIADAAFSADGGLLLTASTSGQVALYDLAPDSHRPALRQPGMVPCLALSPDGTLALTGSDGIEDQAGDPLFRLFDLGSRRVLRSFDTGAPGVRGAAFSPDGRRALSADRGGRVMLWDLTHGTRLLDLDSGDPRAMGAAFLPDGAGAVSLGGEGTLRRWDLRSGALVWEARLGAGWTWDMDLSPDGRFVAISWFEGDRPTLGLWELAPTGPRLLWRCPPGDDNGRFFRLAFSADSRRLAAATASAGTFTWDLPGDGVPARVLPTPGAPSTAVAFSPDGRLLAAGGADNTIGLWDPRGGHELWSVTAHDRMINDLAFSSDGRFLLSAGDDDRVAVLDLELPREQEALEHALELDPADAGALGRLLALHGRWERALEPLLAAQAEGTLRDGMDLVRALWLAGRHDEALAALGEPDSATAAIWRAALGGD
ncbi:MAG: WD40 repeat domain-containing serine/threonine protein kinase [Pseudomonadota bacterium]